MTHSIEYIGLDLGFGNFKGHSRLGSVVVPSHVATNGTSKVGRIAGLQSFAKPLHIKHKSADMYVGLGCENWGRPIENGV